LFQNPHSSPRPGASRWRSWARRNTYPHRARKDRANA